MDPVIVVGAGPVGLVLSLALAAQGVPCVLLDEDAGKDETRPARTVVLREDTAALVERLGCTTLQDEGVRWSGWRSMRRKQLVRELPLGDDSPYGDQLPAPVHVPQHALMRGLRDAIAMQDLVQMVPFSRIDTLEQDPAGVTVHTREPDSTWWRGSYLVGCDGARSTVRKLLDIRFPGRTAVERHAVAALRTELPWPGQAVLHRLPPWRSGGAEVTARPLPDGVWRLDWLLPPRGELVTPDAPITRVRDTLAGWCGGETPPYELLDTGVYTLHHRLARRWRVRRPSWPGTPHICWAPWVRRGSTRGCGTPRTWPGSWHRPGITAPRTYCSTATRRSAGPRSPRGYAPRTSRCRYCVVAEVCGHWFRGAHAGTIRCSPTVIWAAARSVRPPRTRTPPLHLHAPRRTQRSVRPPVRRLPMCG